MKIGALFFTLLLCTACATTKLAPQRLTKIYLAPHGSDTEGSGSESKPFRTLTHASRFAVPGSHLILRGGVYEKSNDEIELHGKPGQEIFIQAYPGEKPILDATDTGVKAAIEAESKTEIFSILELKHSEHVVIDGLELRNSVGHGLGAFESHHITVRNCNIHHIWSSGLGGEGDDLTFENNEVSYTSLMNENDLVLKQRAQGIWSYWAGGAGTWRHEDGSLCKRITFRGNHIHHIWGEGLSALHVDGGVYENNTIHDAYSVLIYVDHSRNIKVRNNILYNTSIKFTRSDEKYPPAAIGLASEFYKSVVPTMSENIEISGNVISNTGLGIYFWRDPDNKDPSNRYRNVKIENNTIHSTFLIPLSFRKINTGSLEAEPLNTFTGNRILSEPYFSLDDNGKTKSVRMENPEIWKLDNNVFPKSAKEDTDKLKFSSFKGNRFVTPPVKPWYTKQR